MKLVTLLALCMLFATWRLSDAAACVDKFASCPTLAQSFGCSSSELKLNCPQSCNLCASTAEITTAAMTAPTTSATKSPYPRDCSSAKDGMTWILPARAAKPMQVYCTQGWQLLQSRSKGNVSFDRSWAEFRTGFGIPSGDYWTGLEQLHAQTNVDQYQLRVEVEINIGNSTSPQWRIARDDYISFSVGKESDSYRLQLGSRTNVHSASAGNDLAFCNGKRFETKDRLFTKLKCADLYKGGFWMEESCGPNLHATSALCRTGNNVCAVYGGVVRSTRLLMKV